MIITPVQIRAARALLRLEQQDISRRAPVPVLIVRQIESAPDAHSVPPVAVAAVQHALEAAGAEFIPHGVGRHMTEKPDAAVLFASLQALSLRSAERLHGQALLTGSDLYVQDGLPA